MPVNVNATDNTMIPIGDYTIEAVGVDLKTTIPENATGVYFMFRSGTGNYMWGDRAASVTPGANLGFRGNADQEIRLDLYPGCPIYFATTSGQVEYQFFTTGDIGSALTRRGK